MEAAVVRATPRIATYFTPMVLAYVLADTEAQGYMSGYQKQAVEALGPWLALAGRDYLPDDLRAQAPRATVARLVASALASSRVAMKAPLPHFTSSTNPSSPAASFFDRIEAVIRSMLSTVPVTSRIA